MENFGSNTNDRKDIFNQIRINLKKNSIETKREHPFNKDYLWKLFKNEFGCLFGKPFFYDNVVAKNIEPIFHYFLESENFFNCENLRSDISAPTFKKGLLLIGNVGVGKTHVMEVFESVFKKYPPHRFKIVPTYKVVEKYEDIKTSEDRKFFYQTYTTGTILFDDLNSEKIASNFGHVNIMREILIRRSTINQKTYLTLNPFPGFENDLNQSLLNLGENYDQRMVDRLYEMFNIIEFKGKSMRR
jgi:DNA replication protein DnaC